MRFHLTKPGSPLPSASVFRGERPTRLVRSLVVVTLLGAALFPLQASAQPTPLSEEVRVNNHTTGSQRAPEVATDGAGNFVVVWDSVGQDGNEEAIIARLYDVDGVPLSGEFQVNTYTTAVQYMPRVARHPGGNFVVVWVSRGPAAGGQDGSLHGCFGQRFNAQGTQIGSEFQINQYTTGRQDNLSVATAADGGFLVTWEGQNQDGSGSAVMARRYGADATPQGNEFIVNTYTTSTQGTPRVCRNTDDDFVVVWDGYGSDNSGFSVFGQRLSADGSAIGTEFKVNSTSANSQSAPSLSCSPVGGFVVVWEGTYQDDPSAGTTGLIGKPFNNDGIALANEFIVNTYTTGAQFDAAIVHDETGSFVVAWQGMYQDGGTYSFDTTVLTQGFDAIGGKVGTEFQVNTYSSGTEGEPAIATHTGKEFTVVWMSDIFSFPFTQDGDDSGVYMRRLTMETTSTTSTTTTLTSTTTTMPPSENCGDANDDGMITATDALSALATAVGAANCPPCRCDVVVPRPQVTASDALAILQAAVQARTLVCTQGCS